MKKLTKRIAIAELTAELIANDLSTANQRIDHLTEMLLVHGVEVINHRRNLSLVGYRKEAENKINAAIELEAAPTTPINPNGEVRRDERE